MDFLNDMASSITVNCQNEDILPLSDKVVYYSSIIILQSQAVLKML